MPSPTNEADLERVLSRAAPECASKRAIWFGEGLPRALQLSLADPSQASGEQAAELAFVEVQSVSARGEAQTVGRAPALPCPVIGLSMTTLEELGSFVQSSGEAASVGITRLICPIAVFDFAPGRLVVREIRHGLTAADLQHQLDTPLWAGPDLKELGSH